MSTRRVTRKVGGREVACGCEFTRDARGREIITRSCQEHEAEHIAAHLAAVVSCSHANRALVEE